MTNTVNGLPDTEAGPDAQHGSAQGAAQTARDEAGRLKDSSVDATREVAETAKEQVSEVASDVRRQTYQLVGQSRDQLVEQAGQQKDRAADGLRAVGEELRGMAEHGQSGWGAQLARHGADYTEQAADFLQNHQPGELLDEVRGLARRRPGAFLLGAAIAGVMAGRLTRALAAGDPNPSSGATAPTTGLSGTATTTGTSGSTTAAGTAVPPVSDGQLTAPPPPPPVAATTPPPPVPTPVAPDPDPGAPVTPRFGLGSEG
jgi:hypothetical protein